MTRSVFARARVNLIGEHTDYTGGLVLPVAVDLGTTVEWQPLEGTIRLRSLALAETVELRADGGSDEPVRGFGRYVAAVARLLDERGRPPAGVAGTLDSTVPIGSGLSSSAALTVSVALALCDAGSFELPRLELARLAQAAETLAVGVPCGLMDPAASLLGRRGHALLLDCSTEEYRHVPLPPDLAILVVDSGVRHSLEHSGYAERRAEVERGVPQRVRHVESENERVLACAAALEQDDRAALGVLFRASHDSLRDDFEVSTPELDLLVELAYEHGAVAARLTGGGFGGSIVALADAAEATALGQAVASDYCARTGLDARARVCASVDAAGRR